MPLSRLALAVTAVTVAAGAVLLLRRRFAVVTVVGPSMRPAFSAGDRVLVHRARLAKLHRGQVVVVEHPGLAGRRRPRPSRRVGDAGWMIKRVAALPGDPALRDHLPADVVKGSARVPPGKLVVLGDNSAVSHDSRQLGYFASDQILGIVVRPMSPG
ncbi:MAG TPA: signal peptidase I [Streptosporangiaceae bacterium]|jgi:signal peptidase I|nr:signal peptidase I [Streptosporangiaceae bacterium]